MPSKVATVAWREFRQTVMRPIFVIAILGIPVLIAGAGGVAAMMLMSHKEPPLVGTIAVVEASGEVAEAARLDFDPSRIDRDRARRQEEAAQKVLEGGNAFGTHDMPFQRGDVRIEIESIAATPDEAMIALLRERLLQKTLLAIALIDPEVVATPDPAMPRGERPKFRLIVAEGTDSDNVQLIEERLGQAIVRVRATRAALEPEQAIAMIQRPQVLTTRVTTGGADVSDDRGVREVKRQLIPMVFMMLIWIGTFTSAQHLMMSTIEEKSTKVMEVLLSAVSPLQLMTGKIIGYGAVGLLIVLTYASLAIAGLVAFATFTDFVAWIDLLYLAVFYVMAYAMIACLLAAVGSAVSDVREANTLMTPVMLVLMVPLMLWMPITHSPNGAVATICSFVPPAIPFAMILRLVAEEPVPLWQVPASIVWGYACVIGMLWFASKVFRVGVLMYGKPPSPLELIKWVRYS
jgi:ABC-type Na+ efflux pump permease subunit